MDALIDFIKILVPASVVLYAAYLIVRSFITREIELKKLEVRGRSIETVLPNRLQAYERMTLFLERINPQNLLLRLSGSGLSAAELQRVLLEEIRNEYNHNASQQVYMSEEVWNQIRSAKEDLILTINDAASKLPQGAMALELSKKIFEMSLEKPADLIAQALSALKEEIQKTF
jgi:hypothetical protein